ncbi:SPFH domain-containing protein [Coralloluteibacterium stylophorae]|uniref:SPFH domain-containing protein n=1 Tax=Coralloluteibacterium stylophorae TaxID=1776034 RepID=A0A8J7VT35_9GAMM|nr:SPFH domain-containing protein [Coralloluteibacterium stylophorae]MBS7457072.1 SPFH domain-containing protein [Coralloluteibacterium stylophorae]
MSLIPMAILVAFLAVALLLALAVSVRVVPEGRVDVVHRFGRYGRALPAGVHLLLPGVERVAHRVSLIDHHLRIPASAPGGEATGADLYFQILDPRQAGSALEQVDTLMRQHADAVLAELGADGAVRAPGSFAEALKAALNRRVAGMGLRVIRCALHTR